VLKDRLNYAACMIYMSMVCCSVLQCVAVRCSVLQCVAKCCSVFAVCCSVLKGGYSPEICCVYDLHVNGVLQCVAVCCSVL